MASFSLATGFPARLLRLGLHLAGGVATLLIPRGSTWAFGSGTGIGDGALALWKVADENGISTVWLTASEREESDAAERGIRTVRRSSLRGWWVTARAGVVVITHGIQDVNSYGVRGSYLVQLWHGIPLKRMELDSFESTGPLAPLRAIAHAVYRRSIRRFRLLTAASHRSRARLESAFALHAGEVVVTGDPRVDVLSAGTETERRSAAAELLDRVVPQWRGGARAVLYAPTWRDGAPDPAIPTEDDWRRIGATLEEHDAVLLVRSHPRGAGEYQPPAGQNRVVMLGADVLPDVTPALAVIDVLITDYSSMAYDVGLLGMPVVYFAPDLDDYTRHRGFYGSYAEVAGTDIADGWKSALTQLASTLADPERYAARAARSRALSAHMHAYRDGRNAHRVYETIRARRDAEGAA